MPRVKDIAWKFVTRLEGDRWCCPYCETVYSGKVTRVRSHFLKQPNKGISSCKKVPEHISKLMDWLQNQVHNKDDKAWKFVDRLGENRWRCYHCREEFCGDLTGVKGHLLKVPIEGISICTKMPDPVGTLMRSLLDEVAEEESRELAEEQSTEAHGHSSMEPKSCHMPTQAEVAEEESREANHQFFTEPQSCDMLAPAVPSSSHTLEDMDFLFTTDWATDMANFNPDLERQFHEALAMPSQAQNSHGESLSGSMMALAEVESCIRSQMQMNDQQTLAGASPFQHDQFPTVDNSNCLQDCNQHFQLQTTMDIDPSIAPQHTSDSHIIEATTEVATNITGPSSSKALVPPQHQSVPHQSETRNVQQNPIVSLSTCLPSALIDMVSCIPSSLQVPNNAPQPSQIPNCGLVLIGPSSLPDMNKGAPMMSHPNTGNNFEENGTLKSLKRKLKRLYRREDGIRDELEYAASLCLKKQRKEVKSWLANVDKLRNDFHSIKAASETHLANGEKIRNVVDVLMQEAGNLMRQGKFLEGLFEAEETKVSKLLEGKMVGEAFQKNTTKILEYLVGNQISRLGIYGMGGVGKTTIMVHVHNRLIDKKSCGRVFWITVSQDFNTQKLQEDIWCQLELSTLQEKDVKKRASKLCNRLMKEGKTTIILDDVWEHFDLEEVGIPVRADGCKLVLTTRSFNVCCQMQCQEKIRIEPLSLKEALRLFLEELGSEVVLNFETKSIVKSIVEECAGLPLGVISMARSMRGVTDVFEWKDSLMKLRESHMSETVMENKVLMKLKFSYDRLGSHKIQKCFLSCALYPEDKLINKFELIEFFIDQGLIDELNMREKQYDRGLTILNKLENVCLLENHGNGIKMHDLIRDMALHIMSVTAIVKAGKGLRILPEQNWTDAVKKVSLMKNPIEVFPFNMSPNCPKLSTLLLNGSLHGSAVIPNSFFKQLWGLEVLNLSECQLIELPNSISDLVNLRALLLRKCQKLHRIPYLGKLRSLRKLDIYGCHCLEALEGLEMLVNLRYLDLTDTCIKRLAEGTLGAMLNLQYLKAQAVNGRDITKLWALETLECYFEDVDDFNECVEVIMQNNNRYYKLTVHQEISKFNVEVNTDARFGNCEWIVRIYKCSHAIVSMGREHSGICILIPKDVQTLTCWRYDGINLSDMGPLENLESLQIEEYNNLGVLYGGQDDEVIDIHDPPAPTPTPLLFPSLRFLTISRCPKLKYLFGHGSKFYFPHLQKIAIYDCEEMVGITAAITSAAPHAPPAFPCLTKIILVQCFKMKRVVEFGWLPHFSNLRDISVRWCENMEEIIGDPLPHMPVEDISLKSLQVRGCRNMRKLLSHELLIYLQNLQSIDVDCCERMVELISGAGQGQEGSIMIPVNNTSSSFQTSISLPKLELLDLRSLAKLKSICEVPITCISMKTIKVHICPKLNSIPLQLRLGEDLPYIEVEGEEKWKTLIWDHPNAQAILQPHLYFCGSTCILKDSERR